jgi:hypothetical protein
VVITGNGGGNSFTLDDLTVSQAPTIPALSFPAMAGLAIGIAALGAVRVRRSRTASL